MCHDLQFNFNLQPLNLLTSQSTFFLLKKGAVMLLQSEESCTLQNVILIDLKSTQSGTQTISINLGKIIQLRTGNYWTQNKQFIKS